MTFHKGADPGARNAAQLRRLNLERLLAVVVDQAGSFTRAERFVKHRLFGCRMCAQCALPSTAYTCPMTCPKQLRNGPCGGVSPEGNCEVYPELRCVWVVAYERAAQADLDLGITDGASEAQVAVTLQGLARRFHVQELDRAVRPGPEERGDGAAVLVDLAENAQLDPTVVRRRERRAFDLRRHEHR